MDLQSLLETIMFLFFAIALMVGFGIVTGLPASRWAGEKLAAFISCLPQERFTEAPPLLGSAASKAMSGNLKEALEEYDRLLSRYPGEKEIYRRMLEIALGPLAMKDYGLEIFRRAMGNITSWEQRKELSRYCKALKKGEFKPYAFISEGEREKERLKVKGWRGVVASA